MKLINSLILSLAAIAMIALPACRNNDNTSGSASASEENAALNDENTLLRDSLNMARDYMNSLSSLVIVTK